MVDDDSYQRFDPSPLEYRGDEEKARAAFRAFVKRSQGPADNLPADNLPVDNVPADLAELIDSLNLDDDRTDKPDQDGPAS